MIRLAGSDYLFDFNVSVEPLMCAELSWCGTNAAQHWDDLGIGLIGPGVITGDIKGYMGCCISYCQAMQNFCINPLNPMPGWYCDGLLPTKVGAPL